MPEDLSSFFTVHINRCIPENIFQERKRSARFIRSIEIYFANICVRIYRSNLFDVKQISNKAKSKGSKQPS